MSPLRQLINRLSPGQKRFVKFCIVGASGVVVNLAFTWLGKAVLFAPLLGLGASDRVVTSMAFLLGIAVSIFTNFLLNDQWTWGDRRQENGAGFFGRMARFYLVCLLASSVQFGTAMGLYSWAGLHYLLAQFIGIGLATVLNYGVNNVWTFRAK